MKTWVAIMEEKVTKTAAFLPFAKASFLQAAN